MWETDVDDLGAGHVERNTVVSIMILSQVRNCRQQKTHMMHLVVERRMDLQKKDIVLEVTQDIVRRAGDLVLQPRKAFSESLEFSFRSCFYLRVLL